MQPLSNICRLTNVCWRCRHGAATRTAGSAAAFSSSGSSRKLKRAAKRIALNTRKGSARASYHSQTFSPGLSAAQHTWSHMPVGESSEKRFQGSDPS